MTNSFKYKAPCFVQPLHSSTGPFKLLKFPEIVRLRHPWVEEHYKHSYVSLHNTENNFYKSTTSIRTSLYMHSHVSLHNTENNFYRASAEGRLGGGSDAPYACSARLGPAYVSIRQHTSLRPWAQLLRQYQSFCTSKTSKLRQY